MASHKKHTVYTRGKDFYFWIMHIPEFLYPFTVRVGKKRLRGKKAYDHLYTRGRCAYENRYSPQCFFLILYREIFHFVGAFLLIGISVISVIVIPQVVAILFLGLVILFITFQEFYLHPKLYNKVYAKSILDWFVWVIPIGLYLFFTI